MAGVAGGGIHLSKVHRQVAGRTIDALVLCSASATTVVATAFGFVSVVSHRWPANPRPLPQAVAISPCVSKVEGGSAGE